MKKKYEAPTAEITEGCDIVCSSGEPAPPICDWIDVELVEMAAALGITLADGVSTVAEVSEVAELLGLPFSVYSYFDEYDGRHYTTCSSAIVH